MPAQASVALADMIRRRITARLKTLTSSGGQSSPDSLQQEEFAHRIIHLKEEVSRQTSSATRQIELNRDCFCIPPVTSLRQLNQIARHDHAQLVRMQVLPDGFVDLLLCHLPHALGIFIEI